MILSWTHLEVSASVGHLAVVRVSQLRTLPLLPDIWDVTRDGATHCHSPDAGHPAQSVTQAKFPLVLTVSVLLTHSGRELWCQSIISAKVIMMSTSQDGHQFHSALNTWTHFLTQVIPAAETSNSFLAGQFRSLNHEWSLLCILISQCHESTVTSQRP